MASKKLEGNSNLLFVELSLEDVSNSGRYIDGVAPGTFTDMHGRVVTIEKTSMSELVRNTLEMIESTRSEGGELVGLPVDGNNHDKGDAAGWIIGAVEENGIVRLLVNWTEIGRNLVSKKIRKFFSATLDPINLRIYGGTLTNWPATRGPNGNNLLRPVELSDSPESHFYSFSSVETSIIEKVSTITDAFRNQFGYSSYYISYSDGIFENHIIACDEDGSCWKVPYKTMAMKEDKGENDEDCDSIEFSPKSEWKEVKKSWIEMASQITNQAIQGVKDTFNKTETSNLSTSSITKKENEMDWDKATPEEKAELRKKVLAELTVPSTETDNIPADVRAQVAAVLGNPHLAQLANMDQVANVLGAEVQKIVAAQVDSIKAQANNKLAEFVAEMNHKTIVSELCNFLTTGSNPMKVGLSVKSADLESFLSSLSQKQYIQAETLFKQIINGGLVEFGENGVDGEKKVTEKLPDSYVEQLRAGLINVSDLSDPILGLGDLSRFDLSEFTRKEK